LPSKPGVILQAYHRTYAIRFWLPIVVAAILIAGCFLPWMTIESKNITISGMVTTGTDYGKPAFFHFLWTAFFLLFFVVNKVWSRRMAMVFTAFNVAWAFRNFFVLPICQMGECPVRRIGLYLIFISSIVLFFAGLLAPVKEAGLEPDELQANETSV